MLSLNQTGLMSSLGQLLDGLCPPYFQQDECLNKTDTIPNVYSYLAEIVDAGEVTVGVEDSGYTSEARRQSLLIMAATTLAQSASDCANVTYYEGSCHSERSDLAEREVGGSNACVGKDLWMCSYASNVLVMAFDETTTSFDYIVSNIPRAHSIEHQNPIPRAHSFRTPDLYPCPLPQTKTTPCFQDRACT